MAAVMDGLKNGVVSRLGMDMSVERTEREERRSESRDRRGEREEKRNKEGKRLLLRLLTVSLEDLRLLMLEAREVLMDLKEAFFLGSGSALPLFLS